MAREDDEDRREAGKLPAGRIARTAKFGGMVAGQGLRWAGTRAANRSRTPERAQEAMDQRAMATASELVEQLGQMKGAAMKIGQVLSTIDWDMVPEGEREAFKEKLSALRDDAPAVPFKKLEKLLKEELGGPLSDFFSDFDEQAVAAASIGQVHRATTVDGADVAVKVQYPGVAEAVDTDLRNMGMLLPLVKRLAPGLDAKALAQELRDRIGEELDYEIEAQNQRQVARAFRGHPFVKVPQVDTTLSARRVLVSEFVDGESFAAVKARSQPERDRFGEIVFRFFFGLLKREHLAMGDPHPGNYLACADGTVCFLDYGLMRRVEPDYLAGERGLARAMSAGDAGEVHRLLDELGYLPPGQEFEEDRLLAQLRAAGGWYLEPGELQITPQLVADVVEKAGSPKSEWFDQMRRQTLPPQALLIRRMEGLVFSVLGELRATGDWHTLAREQFDEDVEPATDLGRAEHEWLQAKVAA